MLSVEIVLQLREGRPPCQVLIESSNFQTACLACCPLLPLWTGPLPGPDSNLSPPGPASSIGNRRESVIARERYTGRYPRGGLDWRPWNGRRYAHPGTEVPACPRLSVPPAPPPAPLPPASWYAPRPRARHPAPRLVTLAKKPTLRGGWGGGLTGPVQPDRAGQAGSPSGPSHRPGPRMALLMASLSRGHPTPLDPRCLRLLRPGVASPASKGGKK